MHDLRYSLRWLRRSPAFTAAAVASFAIGIGVNTALFSVVDAVLFRPLPVRAPGELVDIYTSGSDGEPWNTTSSPDLLDLKARAATRSRISSVTARCSPPSAPAIARA